MKVQNTAFEIIVFTDNNIEIKVPISRGAQIPGIRAIKFCMVAANFCGFSVWNLLHVTLPGDYNFELSTIFLENLWTLACCINTKVRPIAYWLVTYDKWNSGGPVMHY
jgi:hypothetical protein